MNKVQVQSTRNKIPKILVFIVPVTTQSREWIYIEIDLKMHSVLWCVH